jgi:hypothetical protein
MQKFFIHSLRGDKMSLRKKGSTRMSRRFWRMYWNLDEDAALPAWLCNRLNEQFYDRANNCLLKGD